MFRCWRGCESGFGMGRGGGRRKMREDIVFSFFFVLGFCGKVEGIWSLGVFLGIIIVEILLEGEEGFRDSWFF